jgi:hypothetical protein
MSAATEGETARSSASDAGSTPHASTVARMRASACSGAVVDGDAPSSSGITSLGGTPHSRHVTSSKPIGPRS